MAPSLPARGKRVFYRSGASRSAVLGAWSPRAAAAFVMFEPGARTVWHTHPLGQRLIVTHGCGLARHWGGPVEEIRSGDIVLFAPGDKHWHGAGSTTVMTIIATQEQLDDKTIDWLERSARISIKDESIKTLRLCHYLAMECMTLQPEK